MKQLLWIAGIALATCALSTPAAAHVRMRNGSGTPLFWGSPANVGIVINSAGSDDIADGSHTVAIRLAIRAWNDISGTTLQLVENTLPGQQARTDWASNGVHLVLFDESNSSGYLADPGTVAVTLVEFSGAAIVDADILFNGQHHAFTTEVPGAALAFDVGDVCAHELGHLVGLDHSGWAGATMYPYVDPTVVLHRSLSSDEHTAMRAIYPSGVSFSSSIGGRVLRDGDSSPVAGAHVVVRDFFGRTIGGTLSATDGTFTVSGIPAGLYDMAVTPLDFPVSAANLGASYTIETDFAAEIVAVGVVAASAALDVGDVRVPADGLVSLGRSNGPDSLPLRCRTGTTGIFALNGQGLVPGSSLLTLDPSLSINNVFFTGNQVTFNVDVAGGTSPGHADLQVTTVGGERSVLAAAFEITPPDPTVTNVNPATGADSGGTALTITGTSFRAGARVVIGPHIYYDGEPNGCTVVNATTITLTTVATPGGVYDVVAIDDTGVEGRAAAAFTSNAGMPTFTSIFPTGGTTAGGTEVVIRGTNFQAGVTVEINGSLATVSTISSTRLDVVTPAGAAGGPYTVDITNPGGNLLSVATAFSYAAAADPVVTTITPAVGSPAGGQTIQVQGSGFVMGMTVEFGTDPLTGQGGTPATSVTFIDAATLDVVTPALAKGAKNLMVLSPASGQAEVALAAFTVGGGGGGGGGGGCSVADLPRGGGPADPLSLGAWFLAPLLWAIAETQRLRRRALALQRAG